MDKKEHFLHDLFSLVMQNQSTILTMNTIAEFHAAMSRPDVKIDAIADIIKKDTGLTTSVLKSANSSFFGLSRRVSTVKQAVSVLGLKSLERVLLTEALKSTLAGAHSKALDDLWKHSLATAVATQSIISINYKNISEQAFTAGLLHDLGKLLLVNYKSDGMKQIMGHIELNPLCPSSVLEIEIFGVDHQEIGEYFSKKWLFPDNVTDAIRYHHKLNNLSSSNLIPISVAVANNIAKAMEFGKSTSGIIDTLPKWIWEPLKFKQSDFKKVVKETEKKFISLTEFLDDK